MRTTSTLAALVLSAGLSSAALAQEPTEAPTIASLQAALKAAEAAGESSAGEAAKLAAMIDSVAIMLDRRNAAEERVAAVKAVAAHKDPRVLPLLWATSGASSSKVRTAVVDAVQQWDHAEARTILGDRAAARGEMLAIRTQAVKALQATGKVEAAEILYKIAVDGRQTKEIRDLTLEVLDSSFADFMKSKTRPTRAAEPGGMVIAAAGNALAGGVLLNSVGVWGQGDSAPVIGALGGAAIGGGTAALYAKDTPITVGQASAYSSNVAWGLAGGLMASHYLFGYDHQGNESMMALLRAAGVGAGAYTGFKYAQRDPSYDNVMKVNAAGLIGSQLGRSATHLGQSLLLDAPRCDGDSEMCWESEDRWHQQRSQTRTLTALAGAAGGLTLGSMYKSQWKPDSEDALFAAVVGVEGIVASSLLPLIWDADEHIGAAADFGFFASTTGALLASHRFPVPKEQSILIGYGALAGNLLGTGVGLLPGGRVEDSTRAAIIVPGGVAGAIAGGWAHQHLALTEGDWTMVGVGTAISAAQIGAFTFVAHDHGLFSNDDQPAGVLTAGTTLASAGFMAATRKLEPEPIDGIFMGSAAAWGTLYGSVGQVALDLDLEDSTPILVTALSMDAGLAAGGLILSDKTGFGPRDTIVPQLCGVAGATLGSLGVLLATEEGQPVAIGTLTGATLGLGIGAAIAPRLNLGKATAAVRDVMPSTNIDLPGHWSFVAMPAVQKDGQLGTSMQLSVNGL